MSYKLTGIKPFGICMEPISNSTSIDELDVETLRSLFQQHHLVLLRGFNTFKNANDFSDYCESWGEISVWPFGKVLELVEQEQPEDHIFDHSYVPLHWDGMYRPQVPEYQIFHCVKAPLSGKGGRTTFSNTVLALELAPPQLKQQWLQVTGTYQRQMEFYNSKTVSPLVTKHPFRDYSVIRYNEPPSTGENFVNPPHLNFSGIEEQNIASFHQELKKALYHPQNYYAHQWQDGDVVIADNFTLLHGREAFVSKSPRHLRRVQVLSNPPLNNPGLESYK